MEINERTIDHVIETVRSAKKDNRKCTLLIGAGCSVSAGIPLAGGMVKVIANKYPRAYESAPEGKRYVDCMQQLSEHERRNLIEHFVDNAKINWAHLCIALLMQEEYVDRVLTTNFDPLVLRACALLGFVPAVYDITASMSNFKPAFIPEKSVFHLHGQSTGFKLVNTLKESKEIFESLKRILEETRSGRVWIIIGYSGENDPVFDMLSGMEYDNHLYWIGYEKEDPADEVMKKLLSKDSTHLVRDYDADSFFIKLTQELKIFPPDITENPLSHLEKCLGMITEYKPPGSDEKSGYIGSTLEKIKKYRELDEKEKDDPKELTRRAESFFITGDYEKAINLKYTKKDLDNEKIKSIIANSYLQIGLEYSFKSAKESDKAKIESLNNAIKQYKQAIKVKPDKHEAMYNMGISYNEQSMLKEGDGREKLLKKAIDQYKQAIKVKPDKHEAMYNMGLSYHQQSMLKEGDEREKLLKKAIEQYKQAIKVKPDMYEAMYNMGISYHQQSMLKEGDEREKLLKKAIEQNKQAIKVKPDMLEAMNNIGVAYSELSKLKEGKEKESPLRKAIEQYEKAVELKSDYYEAINSIGVNYSELSKIKESKGKESLLRKAIEQYEKAVELKSDYYEAMNNNAAAYIYLSYNATESDKQDILKTALKYCENAEKIKQGSGAYNTACVHSILGNEEECENWLKKAFEYNVLPAIEHMNTDSDLDNVRDKKWFKDFIKERASKNEPD